MEDNHLLSLIADELDKAILMGGWNIGLTVMQKDQPTQQGVPEAPTVYFEKLFDINVGWVAVKDDMSDLSAPKTKEKQLVNTHIQISAMVRQDPMDTTRPTASDVANLMRGYMASRQFRAALKPFQASTLNPGDVHNPYFENDRNQIEAFPSFDIVITHDRSLVFNVGAITTATYEEFTGVN